MHFTHDRWQHNAQIFGFICFAIWPPEALPVSWPASSQLMADWFLYNHQHSCYMVRPTCKILITALITRFTSGKTKFIISIVSFCHNLRPWLSLEELENVCDIFHNIINFKTKLDSVLIIAWKIKLGFSKVVWIWVHQTFRVQNSPSLDQRKSALMIKLWSLIL